MRPFTKSLFRGAATLTAITIGYQCYQHVPCKQLLAKDQPIYTLEHVQLIFRHGARTPVCIYDLPGVSPALWDPEKFTGILPHTDIDYKLMLLDTGEELDIDKVDPTNWSREFLNGGMRKGKLTKVGQQQAYEVGRKLHEEYIKERQFLSTCYDMNEISIRTSSFQRTVNTVRGLISGLYGKENIKEPLKLYTVLPKDEYIYPNFHNCAKLKEWFRFVYSHMLTCLPGMEDDTASINQLLGISDRKDMIDLFHILDLMHTRNAHGFESVPKQMTSKDVELIERRAAEIFAHAIQGKDKEDTSGLRKSIGMLIEDICTNIEKRVENKSPVKMNIVSAHDTTLMGLLLAINNWEEKWPRYVSLFTIELYKDEADNRFVRIVHDAKNLCMDENKQEEMISLERFKSLMERYRVKDYHLECQK